MCRGSMLHKASHHGGKTATSCSSEYPNGARLRGRLRKVLVAGKGRLLCAKAPPSCPRRALNMLTGRLTHALATPWPRLSVDTTAERTATLRCYRGYGN